MSEKKISDGVVHDLPADLKKALTSDAKALETWEEYATRALMNGSAGLSSKKAETRIRRIEWGCSSLRETACRMRCSESGGDGINAWP